MVKRRKRKKWTGTEIVATILLTMYAALVVIPFWNAVVISLETPAAYAEQPFRLLPGEFTWDNYGYLMKRGSALLGAYVSTTVVTFVGTVLGMAVSVMGAYGFSRPFPGKRILFRLIVFTMYFGGGLVPTYLLLKNLRLVDSYMGVVLVSLVSVYNVIILKNGFESVPIELQEAAKIDGANDIKLFRRIMLPLQKPMIATFSLFSIVGFWNSWYWPMLLLNTNGKTMLQLFLRTLVNAADRIAESANASEIDMTGFSMGIRMAAVFAVALPIMVVYPFLQKYFTKGIMVGAVKM